MSRRISYLTVAVESFAAGAIVGLAVNAVAFAAFGKAPSLLVTVVAVDIVTAVWAGWRAVQARRRWLAVLDSFHRPALGEGIDIPGRPPVDGESGDGR